MPPTNGRWTAAILAEQLVPVPEPLVFALQPGTPGEPAAVAGRAARALLDLPQVAPPPPPWLAPHQVPAFVRLCGLADRYGGALLADAVGLGKSYVALAVALHVGQPLTLVVPAVLAPQWRRLVEEKRARAAIVSHESLSTQSSVSPGRFVIVDEAHRFRNPETRRYRRLAEMCIGARMLLVTATPVHNRIADLFHLFRLFLRDDALTALGVGSLRRAALGDLDPTLISAVAARLIVARSRERAGGAAFPARMPGNVIRAGPARDATVARLTKSITELPLGGAAALLRLTLLRRLASSMPAFRATLERYLAFAELAHVAASSGRELGARDFQRLFPRSAELELQLSLLPVVLPERETIAAPGAHAALERLKQMCTSDPDPKAEELERRLEAPVEKTIVFVTARETARYLQRRLGRRRRVAAVTGTSGWFGDTAAPPHEVLAAFAPRAQGAAPPSRALAIDVLIATDLASEGLNLQDAAAVVHYDLPWSPARLAQRVGRVDRLGSVHAAVTTVSFLPPPPLAVALDFERRLARKLMVQYSAGAAQRETAAGVDHRTAALDWCDRLQVLASANGPGSWAHVEYESRAAVLVVRIGDCREAIVVDDKGARARPTKRRDCSKARLTRAPRARAPPYWRALCWRRRR